MNERVLVTGAAGFIGRPVVAELLKHGFTVIATDISTTTVDPRATAIPSNIFALGEQAYSHLGSPDIVIHLAWQDGFVHNSRAHMDHLSDHVKFLNSLVDAGCHHLAVMGSMHEIGYHEGAIDENTPCNPLNQYGVAKNALRQSLLLSAAADFTLQWLRAYYIVGDDASGSSIFAKILQAAGKGQKTFPFTSGINQYDFISLNELATQIVAAATQTDITGIINVCSGKPLSLGERVEQFIADHRLDIKLDYGAFPDRPYDSPVTYGDNTKITTIMTTQATTLR